MDFLKEMKQKVDEIYKDFRQANLDAREAARRLDAVAKSVKAFAIDLKQLREDIISEADRQKEVEKHIGPTHTMVIDESQHIPDFPFGGVTPESSSTSTCPADKNGALSKKLRMGIYDRALQYYKGVEREDESIFFPFCTYLMKIEGFYPYYPFSLTALFPELKKHKPEGVSDNAVWWSINEKGLKARIDMLTTALKELTADPKDKQSRLEMYKRALKYYSEIQPEAANVGAFLGLCSYFSLVEYVRISHLPELMEVKRQRKRKPNDPYWWPKTFQGLNERIDALRGAIKTLQGEILGDNIDKDVLESQCKEVVDYLFDLAGVPTMERIRLLRRADCYVQEKVLKICAEQLAPDKRTNTTPDI